MILNLCHLFTSGNEPAQPEIVGAGPTLDMIAALKGTSRTSSTEQRSCRTLSTTCLEASDPKGILFPVITRDTLAECCNRIPSFHDPNSFQCSTKS